MIFQYLVVWQFATVKRWFIWVTVMVIHFFTPRLVKCENVYFDSSFLRSVNNFSTFSVTDSRRIKTLKATRGIGSV
jgi:hypothetical protein